MVINFKNFNDLILSIIIKTTLQHALKTLGKNSLLETILFSSYIAHPKRVLPGFWRIINMYYKYFVAGRIFLTSVFLFGVFRRFLVVLLVLYFYRNCDYNFYYKKHRGPRNRYSKCPEVLLQSMEEYIQQLHIRISTCIFVNIYYSPILELARDPKDLQRASPPNSIYLFIKNIIISPLTEGFLTYLCFSFCIFIYKIVKHINSQEINDQSINQPSTFSLITRYD